ncbi:hypothetical protein [Teichococcus vastitatis]|uniref:hypothetical protein n=1 Tax=Teichococcus vastitatis TaxID=2307076 RepID=UPI000E76217E|nr:hypothetical protein [Pseudoroseomonas vastitatis]
MNLAPEAPLQAGAALQFGVAMARWLDAAFDALAVLDLSFPRNSLANALPGSLVGIADAEALPRAEAAFLRRFRAAGGWAPLCDAATLAEQPSAARWQQPGARRLAYAEAPVAAPMLDALLVAAPRPWFLWRDNAGGEAAGLLAKHPDHASVALQIDVGTDAARYHLVLPASDAAAAAEALEAAGRRLGLAVALGGTAELQLRLDVPSAAAAPRPPLLAKLPAGLLAHDGAYRSEADGDYSWLWSGPERHLRIALGSLPPFSRWLKLAVIGVPRPEMLDRMAVSLNGDQVPCRLERWSDTSAGVVVDLPAELPPDLILGLSVPYLVKEDQGERRLGFCMDKIEVFS